jgi:hypothetical protein
VTEHILPGDRRLARSHLARAYELDPSLRQHNQPDDMALDTATEQAIIDRAIRAASHAAAPRRATQRILSMFNANKLFQRAPGDAAYREPHGARAHALDSEPEDAAEHIRKALNHVNHGEELDAERLRRYLESALAALPAEAEDVDLAGNPGAFEREAEAEADENGDREEFGPRLGDRRRRARDAMGEVPPRSSVSARGLRTRVDHRRDFADQPQGGAESGADSAHDSSGYDAAALFQRSNAR